MPSGAKICCATYCSNGSPETRWTIAFLEQDLAVLDHRDHRPGDVAGIERERNHAVQPSFEIRGVKRMGNRVRGESRGSHQ
jgi:hypothetical protein